MNKLLNLLKKHDIHVKEFCKDAQPLVPSDSVYLMKDEHILVNLNINKVYVWVSELDKRVESILALLKADNINPQDKEAALKSISETCMPKRLSDIYLKFIYKDSK